MLWLEIKEEVLFLFWKLLIILDFNVQLWILKNKEQIVLNLEESEAFKNPIFTFLKYMLLLEQVISF